MTHVIHAVLGQLLVLGLFAVPWRCPREPYEKSDAYEKTDHGPVRHAEPVKPAGIRVALPEEVVVRTMDAGRIGFLRCFKQAQALDPSRSTFKVKLHLELDAAGTVTSATSDTPDRVLSACLVRVAFALPFPAPRQPAVVDLPLLFRL